MKDIILIGTGGHAKVVLQEIEKLQEYNIVGFTSENFEEDFQGYKVLGNDSVLEKYFQNGVKYAFIAIGSNKARKSISQKLTEIGYKCPVIISPNAHIGKNIDIGEGTIIMPGVYINVDSTVGKQCIINTSASVDHDNVISDFVHIGPGSHLAGTITIGEGTFIGLGTSIIPGQTVGKWCTIGAGSVIINEIPDNSTVVGVPANKYL